jgi:4-carboxymuconolactone decarboxylase
MDKPRHDAGMKARREVLGDQYVDRAVKGANEFTRPFQELVTEYCWGVCWTDDNLSRQQRSLLNLGMLAALGRSEEFELHFRGALGNGLSRDELQSALIQIAVYCGIPAGIDCFRIARRVIDEEDGRAKA